MAIVPALHRETVSGDPPEAVWPWPDDSSDCHCLTLRYSPDDETGANITPALPALAPARAPVTVWALWTHLGSLCEQYHVHEGRTSARAMALTAERISRRFGSDCVIVALLVSPTLVAIAEAEQVGLALLQD